jgi:hypothetical protein
MALTFTSFETFAEVADMYERITPMRGDKNIGKDIRPIGDRNRKYERIVKISNSCYALSDGWHYGDDYGSYWLYNNTDYRPTLKDMERYAPIVWRKKRDGTELVTFRNAHGEGAHNLRYAFLYRHTPRGIDFKVNNGRQFLAVGGKDYYLAKGHTVPRVIYDKVKQDAAVHAKNVHTQKRAAWNMVHDDNTSITFTKAQGDWQWVSGGRDLVMLKHRVNKDLKAKLKPHIDAFRDWAFTITPMLPTHDYRYRNDMINESRDWVRDNKKPVNMQWGSYALVSSVAREVVTDEDHPMRLHLAVTMQVYINNLSVTAEDDSQLKAQFNRWANKQFGLIKTVKE